ncbi:c-type cytochrome domain-containing protein [Allomuricauda sp. R78024]|uniref:c-type cytochrome domain-containing protein n=1 Tax=Allomuricauda sp. R78024 TaxID=3093867 RepID=UPI0037C651D1
MQLGNLHPLFVHLPIGILVLAFLMELYYYKKPAPKDNGTILFALGIGALSALFSIGSGWLLGDNGGYDEELLSRHRWIAVAFSVGALLLFFLKKSVSSLAKKSYFPVFVLVLILLTLTGHFGGSLTHGEDFLFEEAYEEPVIEDIEQAAVFSDVIQPIFQQKCVSCHNSGKAKGGLLLTSKKELLAGGDSGSLLDSLEQEKMSLLMHRLHLPIADKEHMPPKGKVQLTAEEVLLLNWWMKNENCFDCVVKNLHSDEKLDAVLASLEKDTSVKALIAEKVDIVPLEFISTLSQNNISAQLASEEVPLLSVNFLKRKDLSEEDFDLLKPYRDNIVEINLGHTNLTDELAKQLKQFKHLTKLQLQNTEITNAIVPMLSGFEFLESLNLYGSELDDSALSAFTALPNLKSLYVWQTKMTKDGLSEFQKQNEAILVQSQVADSVFASSTLTPPTILADQEIFKDSVKVSIEQYFEGAKVYYITENSKNDTIPKEYSEPFYLTETSTLKTYATSDNWEPSLVSTAHFLKNQVEVSNITLAGTPHPKYKAQGGKTLMDLKRGTTNFVDGNWVGYESQHMTATIEFKEQTTVSNISVGSLSIPTSWIFFPVGYTVWGSTDGNNFRKIKTIKLPKPEPSIDIERMAYNIAFDPISLKKVKLFVESPLKNPDWHIEPGGNSFIFLDELVFN